MSEFLRKYWFVCLVAIAMIAGLVYFIMDQNKYNVSGIKKDGHDVLASTTLGDVTSDEIFDNYQDFNQSLLYNMYQKAVVDQSVEASAEMKTKAKAMTKNIKANMNADASGKTRFQVLSELASYGFNGEDSLYDYCLFAMKAAELNKEYLLEHFDELKNTLNTSPRTISVITLEVPNAEILTKEKESKKESIDKALANGDSFAKTATAFSEDINTAGREGYYGYIDTNTTDLDSAVINAAIVLNKGEYSDWITTQNEQTGMYNLYLVYVNEDDPQAILESSNLEDVDSLVNAYVSSDSTLAGKAVAQAAASLNIQFDNEQVKEKIDAAIAQATGAEQNGEAKEETKKDEADKADSEENKDQADSEKETEESKDSQQKEDAPQSEEETGGSEHE